MGWGGELAVSTGAGNRMKKHLRNDGVFLAREKMPLMKKTTRWETDSVTALLLVSFGRHKG